MADTSEYKYYDITDTSDNTERHLGVAAVNKKGEFGFANDTDEKPYLPAGGEKTLRGEGVSESLTYEQFHWGDNVKVKETLASKTDYYSEESKAERTSEADARMEKSLGKPNEKPSKKEELETIELENSISVVATKEKPKQAEVKSSTSSSSPKLEGIEKDQVFEPAAGDTKSLIPESVSKSFVQDGKNFYFKGTDDKLAFQDSGTKLKTKIDGDLVADSMISIAKNRGWSEIKVTGTESFKKDIWTKATEQGIAVKGYTPTKVEVAEMKEKGIDIPKQGQAVTPEKNIDIPKQSQATTSEKSALTPEQEKSKAFKELSAAEAVKKHPDLAPYIAAVAAIQKKVQADNLSKENQQAIMDRVRENTANSIDNGVIPKVALKEVRQVTAQAQLSR